MPFKRVPTCVALLTLTLPAVAGVNSFTPTGPEGAATYDVAYVGGGRLDYLLLVFLFFTFIRTPSLRRRFPSCVSALKKH